MILRVLVATRTIRVILWTVSGSATAIAISRIRSGLFCGGERGGRGSRSFAFYSLVVHVLGSVFSGNVVVVVVVGLSGLLRISSVWRRWYVVCHVGMDTLRLLGGSITRKKNF